jgi:hypothetical protein
LPQVAIEVPLSSEFYLFFGCEYNLTEELITVNTNFRRMISETWAVAGFLPILCYLALGVWNSSVWDFPLSTRLPPLPPVDFHSRSSVVLSFGNTGPSG